MPKTKTFHLLAPEIFSAQGPCLTVKFVHLRPQPNAQKKIFQTTPHSGLISKCSHIYINQYFLIWLLLQNYTPGTDYLMIQRKIEKKKKKREENGSSLQL